MAFNLPVRLVGYEVRAVREGVSKAGKPYKVIKVEDQDGYDCELSCSDASLFGAIETLRKGQIINADVRAVSGKDSSYVKLTAAPQLVTNAYDDLD
jgi:hypothetical protein